MAGSYPIQSRQQQTTAVLLDREAGGACTAAVHSLDEKADIAMKGVEMRKYLAAGVVAAASMFAAVPALATDTTTCLGLIDALYTNTDGATFTGMNAKKDESGLLGKLSDARNKLNQQKNLDSIGKLEDYKMKLGQVCSQGKIVDTGTVCSSLSTAATEAQQCISNIGK
jgi:hypothetical protein